jgi:hypothetical protein
MLRFENNRIPKESPKQGKIENAAGSVLLCAWTEVVIASFHSRPLTTGLSRIRIVKLHMDDMHAYQFIVYL